MKAIIFGVLFIAAAVFVMLPPDAFGFGLGWNDEVINFLKGCAPVVAILLGIIGVFLGIADMKDRAEARREEKAENNAS